MIKVYYMNVWKYYHEIPHTVQLACANKNVKKMKMT
jgi:hypothetical protein